MYRIDVHARLSILRKNPPCTVLFWSARLLILKKISPLHVYFVLHSSPIWSAHLLILRKNSPLHGLILVCTFIDFETIFPPGRLFRNARLFGALEYACNVAYKFVCFKFAISTHGFFFIDVLPHCYFTR